LRLSVDVTPGTRLAVELSRSYIRFGMEVPRFGVISAHVSMSWYFEWGRSGTSSPRAVSAFRGKAKSQSGPSAGSVAVAGTCAPPTIHTSPSERGNCPPTCRDSGTAKQFPVDAAQARGFAPLLNSMDPKAPNVNYTFRIGAGMDDPHASREVR